MHNLKLPATNFIFQYWRIFVPFFHLLNLPTWAELKFHNHHHITKPTKKSNLNSKNLLICSTLHSFAVLVSNTGTQLSPRTTVPEHFNNSQDYTQPSYSFCSCNLDTTCTSPPNKNWNWNLGTVKLNGQHPKKHGQKHSTTTANSSFALVAFCIPLHASSIVGLFFFFSFLKKKKIK